eukprot:6088041-Pleurochrysis_carterae.AAC.1
MFAVFSLCGFVWYCFLFILDDQQPTLAHTRTAHAARQSRQASARKHLKLSCFVVVAIVRVIGPPRMESSIPVPMAAWQTYGDAAACFQPYHDPTIGWSDASDGT